MGVDGKPIAMPATSQGVPVKVGGPGTPPPNLIRQKTVRVQSAIPAATLPVTVPPKNKP